MADDQRDRHPDGAVAVVRRAPFSDNPEVGARGQRTQQRILDAALQAFGEDGYHGSSIERITKLAPCSRVSFYQYFASKEDVFRHLAEQVSRQVTASTEMLDPLTPELEGWEAMRAWVGRYVEIHARYEPVFHALESDDVLAAMAAPHRRQNIARIHSRLATTTLPPRQLDPVIRLLLECLIHTLDVTGILRSIVPAAYPSERVEAAITDVLHRTLFGAARRRERAPAERFATACPRVQPRDARVAPAGRGDPRTECFGERRARRAPGHRGATSSSPAATTTPASTISSRPPASPTEPSTGTSATRMRSRGSSRRVRCAPWARH